MSIHTDFSNSYSLPHELFYYCDYSTPPLVICNFPPKEWDTWLPPPATHFLNWSVPSSGFRIANPCLHGKQFYQVVQFLLSLILETPLISKLTQYLHLSLSGEAVSSICNTVICNTIALSCCILHSTLDASILFNFYTFICCDIKFYRFWQM